MNYGKKSASKKRNSLISRSSMMGKRAHVSFIRVLFIGLIALCVAVSSLGIGSIRGILANTPDVNEVDIMPLGYATFLYDCNGNQIRKLAAPNANRLPVSIDQIPEDLQHAVVAIEDERFYEHNGIDVRGILRAFVKNLSSGNLSDRPRRDLTKNGCYASRSPMADSKTVQRFKKSSGIIAFWLPRDRSRTSPEISDSLSGCLLYVRVNSSSSGISSPSDNRANHLANPEPQPISSPDTLSSPSNSTR